MKQSRLFNYPFYITILSLFMPMLAAYFWIELHRWLLIFSVFIFSLINILEKNKFFLKKSHFLFIAILIGFFACDLAMGRKLYFFSYSHIAIYTSIFYYSFIVGKKRFNYKVIIKQISFIYCLLLIFMLFELWMHLSGNFNLLLSTFAAKGDELSIQQYLEYHNRFASKLNINVTALNSILLGNQIGSQIALCAFIWFFPFYYGIKSIGIFKHRNTWFFLAGFLLIMNPTMMTYLIFIIILIILLCILPISKIKSLKIGIIIASSLIVFSSIIIEFMFPLFFNDANGITFEGANFSWLGYYIYGMVYPVFTFFDLSLFDKLLGTMQPGWSEFGYFKLLVANGVLWTSFMSISIFIVIYSSIKLSNNFDIKAEPQSEKMKLIKAWIWIAQVNTMIIIIYFLSLVHYLVIFRLGVLQLFGFHISIAMFAITQVKALRNNSIIEHRLA